MRRPMMLMVSLALLLSLGGSASGAILPDITNWGGSFLLSLVQEQGERESHGPGNIGQSLIRSRF